LPFIGVILVEAVITQIKSQLEGKECGHGNTHIFKKQRYNKEGGGGSSLETMFLAPDFTKTIKGTL
jgi:hypothetical protein